MFNRSDRVLHFSSAGAADAPALVPISGQYDTTVAVYAALADAAYIDNDQGVDDLLVELFMRYGLSHFDALPDFTTSTSRAFIDRRNDRVIIANRGTDITDTNDIAADIQIALDTEKTHSRFTTAEDAFKAVRDAYPDMDIILTGHSLGATVNRYVYERNKNDIHEIYNFNPGSSPLAVLKSIKYNPLKLLRTKRDKKIRNYHIKGDLISYFATLDPSAEHTILEPQYHSNNPHSIRQFY